MCFQTNRSRSPYAASPYFFDVLFSVTETQLLADTNGLCSFFLLFNLPADEYDVDEYDAVAHFGCSQRGAATLIFGGQSYVKDREFLESVNWRCALFRRHKCRARAITRRVGGVLMVKASLAGHTHDIADADKRKKSKAVSDGALHLGDDDDEDYDDDEISINLATD